ncbi:Prolyl 4-hydroxylase subunit alpha-2 [Caligus rogercresseyi]|uniref:procollagen-proline 4-dioxygenase n=1 Tax=Caligus rogercresseyi TaxID=217165 RepID=A0A7T8HGF7_CALRO|nr:Prolyl 4-hydroxylase subunit alpha-2 [Caligus rogercresseyi]
MRGLTLSLLLLCLGHSEGKEGLDVHEVDDSGYTVLKENTEQLYRTIYTSMHEMAKFWPRKRNISKKLVDMSTQGNLGAYIASYEDVIGLQDDEDSEFLNHPLNAYNLIRHVAVGWGVVEDSLQRYKESHPGKLPKRVRKLLTRSKRDHVPGAEDLDGASIALVRLHDYYNFNLTSFVEEGIIETQEGERYETTGDLSVWDIFKIGVKGTNMLMLGSGIEIMSYGLSKAKREGLVSTPPFVDGHDFKTLKNIVKTAKTVHDQKLDRWGPLTSTHSTNKQPYDKRLGRKKKFNKPEEEKIILNNPSIVETFKKPSKDLRPQSVLKELTCRYEDRGLPYYRYGPHKLETVSLRPRIVVVHDFIVDSVSREFIRAASPGLRRSSMQGNKNGTHAVDDRRVSEQSWLTEDIPAARKLTDKINDYLNLLVDSTVHSELYQVANYGTAGHYGSHYDQVLMGISPNHIERRNLFNIQTGDRMASIMGYLSNVEAGGNTVFPLIGASIKPRKGSLVLWWNMDDAGGYDLLTRHGGCPVMIGSKWITNKWVRCNSQMFKRPCPKYTGKQIRKFRNNANFQRGGWISDP